MPESRGLGDVYKRQGLWTVDGEQTYSQGDKEQAYGQGDGEQGYGLRGKVQVYEQGIIEIVHATNRKPQETLETSSILTYSLGT